MANNVKEISVPVPWGHVAGKLWGRQEDKIVLVFHGAMDNAGSFDRLIPLLPKSFCYICFDLPSHGKSSHFPPHLPIHTFNFLLAYKLIVEYFQREKYIIMGHSYGSQIGYFYAQLYPEHVEQLIMLDSLHLYPTLSGQFKYTLRDRIEFVISLDNKMKTRTKPRYTYSEALEKIQERYQGYITVDAAKALLHRALLPTEDGKFEFTIDQRMKSFINPIHDFRYIIETMKKYPVKCPHLIILGKDSSLQQVYMKCLLDVLKKNKNVYIKQVDGHHDVHNNNPETVAPYITKALLKNRSKL